MQLMTNREVGNDRTRLPTMCSDTETLLSRLSVNVMSFSTGARHAQIAPHGPAENQLTILYVVKGQGSLAWAGGEITLSEGTIAVIPNTLRTFFGGLGECATAPEISAVWISEPDIADGDGPSEAGESLIFASSVVAASAGHGLGFFESLKRPLVEDSHDPLLGSIFGGILAEMETGGIGSKCIVESLMKQVLIVLLRRTLLHQKNLTPLYQTIANPSLALIINTIQDSHAERLSIPGLARMVGMTPFGLTREFERIFGESLLDYIQGVRLRQASNLLTQTNLPIKSIAASVGFASRSHFSRAFRKHQGEDPTSFRKTNSADAEEPIPERAMAG